MNKLRYLKVFWLAVGLLGAAGAFATGFDTGGGGGTPPADGGGGTPPPAGGGDEPPPAGGGGETPPVGGGDGSPSPISSVFGITAAVYSVMQLDVQNAAVSWSIDPLDPSAGAGIISRPICIYTNLPNGLLISANTANGTAGTETTVAQLIDSNASNTFQLSYQISLLPAVGDEFFPPFNGAPVALQSHLLSSTPCTGGGGSHATLFFSLNIPGGVNLPAGNYTDTLTLKVEPALGVIAS